MAKQHAAGRASVLSAANLRSWIARRARTQGIVTWGELRSEFPDTKRLRNVVRGLVRNGELQQDQAGNYYLAGAEGTGERLTGTLVPAPAGSGVRLAVRPQPAEKARVRVQAQSADSSADVPLAKADGEPARRTRDRQTLREGDVVSYLLLDASGTARVVDVLRHSGAPVVGVVALTRFGPVVESLSPDYRGKVALDELPAQVHEGDTVNVRVTGSDRFGLRGDVTGVVTRGDVADAAALSLLASYNVPEDWPRQRRWRLPMPCRKMVQPGRFRNRLNLTDTPLVTIDGADARDFDDAVFAAPRRGGGWRLLVAIADVGHYVKSGSELDRAAYERGTSVYLPDRVIPMLPESLSNGLCSLRPHEHRLALVCDMQISKRGRITGYSFHEALIRSWARLTYSQVNDYLENGVALPSLAGDARKDTAAGVRRNVDQLHRVFQALQSARGERGALEFATRSGALQLQNGRVKRIVEVTRNDAHRLIEEAMIAANVCAARFINESKAHALYRVHEPPQSDKAEGLRDALAYVGIRVRTLPSKPRELAKLLEPLADRDDAWLLYMLILRAMSQACYQPENVGHFGLALTDYMHFTSPIRRYPDLIVHRVIKALLNSKRPPLQGIDKLLQAGEHLSSVERRAEEVERGVSNWLKCDFVADRVGETFDGIVVGVQDFGLFVELDGYFVQGLVHVSNLGEDYFSYVAESMSLVGERSGRHFSLGDRLQVVLQEVLPAQGKLDLVPVSVHRKQQKRTARGGSARGSGKARRRKPGR